MLAVNSPPHHHTIDDLSAAVIRVFNENKPSWAFGAWLSPYRGGILELNLRLGECPNDPVVAERLKTFETKLHRELPEVSFKVTWHGTPPRKSAPKNGAPSSAHSNTAFGVTAKLREEIHQTLPTGVFLLKTHMYSASAGDTPLRLLVTQLACSRNSHDAVTQWRKEFESKHPDISLLIDRVDVLHNIQDQLTKIAGSPGKLITKEHIPHIGAVIKRFYGKPPRHEGGTKAPDISKIDEDLTHLPFLTIDPVGVREREDALCAVPMRGGGLKLYVAFIDVTDYIKPRTREDEYARRVGVGLWGARNKVSPLGPVFAEGPGSFLEGEVRPAWVVEVELSKKDPYVNYFDVKRCLVKVAQHVPPDTVSKLLIESENTEVSDVLKELSKATGILRNVRSQHSIFYRDDDPGVGGTIVQECMIAAKSFLGQEVQRRIRARSAGLPPALFRVHAAPTPADVERVIAELKALNIPGLTPEHEDFFDAKRFTGLLRALEDAGHWSLTERILHLFLGKSTYSRFNKGHYALGVSAYLEPKARFYGGLVNQYVLRSMRDTSYPKLTSDEVAARELGFNRQLRRSAQRQLRLNMLEALETRLSHIGDHYEAAVTQEKSGVFYLDVPGFSRWGRIDAYLGAYRPGEKIKVVYMGYSPYHMRDTFRCDTESLGDSSKE